PAAAPAPATAAAAATEIVAGAKPPVAPAPIRLTQAPGAGSPMRPYAAAPSAAPAAAPSAGGNWTVVVLSVRSIGSARDEVARLEARGLAAETHAHGTMNRVTVGRFTSKESAHAYAMELASREHLQAWVTQVD
ncbi:MAG TPA: SPOR domain-containing protein, partial [Nevskiaceae bacterium]|nr:SPOR domain-containing protein [Nevskiaceae bacterium]